MNARDAEVVSEIVDELFGRPREQGLSLGLVARRAGETVVERYGERPPNDFQPTAEAITADTPLISWSMAKSMTHAAVGILVGDGLLVPEAPAPVAEWTGTDKAEITLDHLLEMRSGLAFVEDYVDGETSNCLEMLYSGTIESYGGYAAAQPLAHRPGAHFSYSSGTTNIVARIVGDVVAPDAADAAERQRAVAGFLARRLFEPAGMNSAVAQFDPSGDFVGSSYVHATASDFARFGELYLRDGVGVTGERIVPVGWVAHGVEPVSHDPESGYGYGRHWWLWPAFPGSFACHGFEGQFILVVPRSEIVIAHLGKTPVEHGPGLATRLARLAQSMS